MPIWIAILAVAAPALLLALVPRRWRLWAMLAWLTLPFSGTAVATVGYNLIYPGAYPVGTLFYGLALVFPLIAIPWVICCGVGFALGIWLNRRLRGTATPAAPAPPPPIAASVPAASPLRPAEPATAVTANWRCVHVGISRDGLTIGGADVWAEPWRPIRAAPVVLPDPGHSAQCRRYDHYEIGPAAAPARFLATELSNGVWAFWVAETPPPHPAAADAPLRFEYRSAPLVNGRYDPPNPWAVLIDGRSGEVLLDCSDWALSQISARADGNLLLHLGQNDYESAFHITPATRLFAPVGTVGAEQSLSALPAVVAEAFRAASRPGTSPRYRRFSPDASIRVDLESVEWANSHWVNSPRVIDVATGLVALDLWGSPWDAWVSFPRPGCVRLRMRNYRLQGRGPTVDVDLAQGSYQIVDWPKPGTHYPAAPLAGCAAGLAAVFPGADPGFNPAAPARRGIAWRSGALILLGALVAIAAASVISTRLKPPGLHITPMAMVPRLDLPPPQRR